ncbi:S1C family serine protease, partial [Streptomyces coeruleorubidus]|uniref:S1C family serine protease n=1 Tax=Streptomyces coeruleorubidus TaxID=116188 RepID=UPI0036F7EC6D
MDVASPPARPRSRALARVLPLIAGCCVVLLGGCSGGGASTGSEGGTKAARAAAPRAANDLQDDYQKVIKDVLPSVVQIQATSDLGSGVVYDDKGHIVTNAHVVGDEKTFKVTTANSEDELTAKLVSTYPQQDLAVIKLDRKPKGLKAAGFGDSSKVDVGQIVLAMGSPLGLSSSVTQGIVSATGRT